MLASTAVSLFTTPALLHFAGSLTTGDYGEDLRELAQGGAGTFLIAYVLLPSFAGMLAGQRLGPVRATALRLFIQLSNSCILLLLCYANAAVSLPAAFAQPDWDFLSLVLLVTTVLWVCLSFSGLLFSPSCEWFQRIVWP